MVIADREEVSFVFDEYYTLKDAARILGMKWRTLGDQIRRGEVSAVKAASIWLIHSNEVERLRQNQPV